MSRLICIDPGHGANTPGKRTPVISELGRSIREYEFNKAVSRYLDAELKRCGFRTMYATLNDNDTALSTRTNRANAANADAYVSCHYNAGGGQGVETFHYPGSTKGKNLAQAIQSHVIKGTAQRDRGVKTANFQVLRQTKMPAALVEYGFMDDPTLREARLMLNKSFQQECARETAQGICQYFGVPYKGSGTGSEPPSVPAVMYDVYIGDSDQDILSTAYINKLTDKVKELAESGEDAIHLYRRDSKNNPRYK